MNYISQVITYQTDSKDYKVGVVGNADDRTFRAFIFANNSVIIVDRGFRKVVDAHRAAMQVVFGLPKQP